VAVRIESKKITEGLHGDDSAGDGIIFRNRILEKNLQGFPGAAAETSKELPIVKKIPAKNLRDAKNKMSVRDLLRVPFRVEDFHAQPLPEFHHALLMAGWTKMPSFTRKCQQIFMAAVFAFHTGKAVVEVAAIQITVDHLFNIRPPETILP
jgi:hypothetical protein